MLFWRVQPVSLAELTTALWGNPFCKYVIRLAISRVVKKTVWSLLSEQGVLDETSL